MVHGTDRAVGKGCSIETSSRLGVLVVPQANCVLGHCWTFAWNIFTPHPTTDGGKTVPKSLGELKHSGAVAAQRRLVMLRNLAFVVGYAVILASSTVTLVAAADFGTPEDAKAMLERAV